MVKIVRYLTQRNFTPMENKKNLYLVLHYVGAVSTAENNASYFHTIYRGASAHYFVDPKSIWQIVEEGDASWSVGTKTYYNSCRNNNCIAIEMCCKKDKVGNWMIDPATIENTIELAADICRRNSIPLSRVVRHWDTTKKRCPEPWVRVEQSWTDFKKELEERIMEKPTEPTEEEKIEAIKKFYNIDGNTIQFVKFYKHGGAFLDKLYVKTPEGQKA